MAIGSDLDVRTGPGTLAGRYLRSYWQPVFVSSELPVGAAKPLHILGEDYTLYRGEGGAAHVVAFRCAHRGTQLSVGFVRGEALQCLYHGWTYAADGTCIAQPAEPKPYCAKTPIRSYPARDYLGFVFAYLGEGEAPELPRFPEFEEAESLEIRSHVDDCNFFNRIDQAADTVHVTFAHPQLGWPLPLAVRVEETVYGLRAMTDLPDGSTELTHFHMPNANEISVNGSWFINWRVPVDDAHYHTFGLIGGKRLPDVADSGRPNRRMPAREEQESTKELGDAILRGDLTITEILDRPNAVQIQDYVVAVGQGPIAPRADDHLGHEDAGVILVRKIWSRELAAFAKGEKPRIWARTGPLQMRIAAPQPASEAVASAR